MSHRWWIAGVVVIVLAAAVVWVSVNVLDGSGESAANHKNECRISELSQPDGKDTVHTLEVSGSGEYIAGDGEESAIRWHNGKPETIDDVGGVTGVNSSGVMIGSSQEDSGSAWRYDDDVTELKSPHDSETLSNDINDSGDVVGVARDDYAEYEVADGDPVSTRGYPLLWKAESKDPVELEVEDGMRANATAVTSDGDVMGYQVKNGTDDRVPWRWGPDGKGEELPAMSDEEQATPVDIAGEWVLSTTASDGYRWKLSEPDKTQKLRLDQQSATAIDATGTAYGLAKWTVPGRQLEGEVDALENLANPDDGNPAANEVSAASDDGSVLIGTSLNTKGDAVSVTWSCG